MNRYIPIFENSSKEIEKKVFKDLKKAGIDVDDNVFEIVLDYLGGRSDGSIEKKKLDKHPKSKEIKKILNKYTTHVYVGS